MIRRGPFSSSIPTDTFYPPKETLFTKDCCRCFHVPRAISVFTITNVSSPLFKIILIVSSQILCYPTVKYWMYLGLHPWTLPLLTLVFSPDPLIHFRDFHYLWPTSAVLMSPVYTALLRLRPTHPRHLTASLQIHK